MKNTFKLLVLTLGMAVVSAVQAYAVPVVDGAVSPAGEWTDTGYSYYLEVFDPNETAASPFGNIPDAYDISHVVLLQELDSNGGDGNPANDGIYILIEVYGANPTLEDYDSSAIQLPKIGMTGDFNGDGSDDILLSHDVTATNGTGQSVTVTNLIAAVSGDLVSNGGAFSIVNGGKGATGDGSGACGAAFPGCTLALAVEYFIPTGTFGTPSSPFPITFIGTVVYDNGGQPADDIVMGSAFVPEPGTFFLLGAGLLSLLGFRKKQ